MNHWSPAEWSAVLTAVISSVAGAAVSVINAVKGHADRREIKARLKTVEAGQAAHEQAAERRSRLPLAGRLGH